MNKFNILFLVTAIVLMSSDVLCVDRNKFLTCEQQQFCNDMMKLAPNAMRYKLLPNTVKCENAVMEAKYVNTEDKDEIKSKILVQISGVESLEAVRVKITEVDPSFHRLDVFRDILSQGIQDEPRIDGSKKLLSSNNQCVMHLNNNVQLHFQYEPLLIYASDGNSTFFSLNEHGLLQVESHKDSNGARIFKNSTNSTEKVFPDVPKGRRAISLDVNLKNFDQLYGLPEHTDSAAMDFSKTQPYRLYNLDVFEYEIDERMALYGAVPFVHALSAKKSVGIFWNNIAETWVDLKSITKNEFVIFKRDTGDRRLQFVSESGIVDLFVMFGPTPRDVSQQFASIIGYQQLPPLTSVGFHQCRWNYMSQKETLEIVEKFDKYDIPLDYVWLDIEHTDRKKYFTWEPTKFNDPVTMVTKITSLGRRLVTIVDPHIATLPEHKVYNDFIANNNLFVVKNPDGKRFEGWCWPGNSVYPDLLNPKAREHFSNYFQFDYYKGSTIDVHTWIDMNEPSVFSGPEVTLPKDVVFYGGWENRDVHNIYGFLFHESVFQGLLKRTHGRYRPFILTRSFYAGTQKFGAVWTGDNAAKWSHLKVSVPMLLSLSVSGIHFVGADAGGFFGHPTEELYIRWMQAASMTPFFRSHAHLHSPNREPWTYSNKCLDITRDAITKRYTYLPYLYFGFYESSVYGTPIMRPLWFNFPQDTQTFNIEHSFMIGDALLAVPVLDEGSTQVHAYFPTHNSTNTLWYDTETYQRYDGGKTYEIKAELTKFPLFQKDSTIVARWMRRRRSASRMYRDPITLVVIPNEQGFAEGKLYMDDFDTTDHKTQDEYLLVHFMLNNSTLNSTIVHQPKNLKVENAIERIIVVSDNLSISSRYRIKKKAGALFKPTVPLELPLNSNQKNSFIIRDPKLHVAEEFSITLS